MSHKQGKFGRLLSVITNQEYIFSVVSKFLGVLIAIIYSIFYNRYLGASLKGEAAIIMNYISIISSVLCLGMYQAYPFYRKKEQNVFHDFINNMTSFYMLLLAASVIIAGFVKSFDINIRVALVIVPIQAYIRHINYVVTIENPRLRNISSIIINLVDLFVVSAMWIFTAATYNYLVLILIVQTVINLIVSYSNLKTGLKCFKFTLALIPKYAKFGFIPMITLFLMTLNYRVDILMLERTSFIAKNQIGIYSVGVSLAEKVWLIPDAVKDILLSKLCKGKGGEEVAKVIRLNLAIAILAVVFVALISKPFVALVYGSEYVGADVITTIMLTGIIGMIFYKMVYSYNISQGKRLVNLIFLGVAATANVIGNIILIPIMGIYGAALTSVVSYMLCGICFLIYFHHVSHVPYWQMLFVQRSDFVMIKRFLAKKDK